MQMLFVGKVVSEKWAIKKWRRVENDFHLDVVSHLNQQSLGHWYGVPLAGIS